VPPVNNEPMNIYETFKEIVQLKRTPKQYKIRIINLHYEKSLLGG
jgi:hypothetical protein